MKIQDYKSKLETLQNAPFLEMVPADLCVFNYSDKNLSLSRLKRHKGPIILETYHEDGIIAGSSNYGSMEPKDILQMLEKEKIDSLEDLDRTKVMVTSAMTDLALWGFSFKKESKIWIPDYWNIHEGTL